MRGYRDIIACESSGGKRGSEAAVKNVGNEKCN